MSPSLRLRTGRTTQGRGLVLVAFLRPCNPPQVRRLQRFGAGILRWGGADARPREVEIIQEGNGLTLGRPTGKGRHASPGNPASQSVREIRGV